jgi:hypothetical protein
MLAAVALSAQAMKKEVRWFPRSPSGFRQAQASLIVINAHRINRGEFPATSPPPGKKADFYFIEKDEPEEAMSLIKDLCVRQLPMAYHLDSGDDIQVMTPIEMDTHRVVQHYERVFFERFWQTPCLSCKTIIGRPKMANESFSFNLKCLKTEEMSFFDQVKLFGHLVRSKMSPIEVIKASRIKSLTVLLVANIERPRVKKGLRTEDIIRMAGLNHQMEKTSYVSFNQPPSTCLLGSALPLMSFSIEKIE